MKNGTVTILMLFPALLFLFIPGALFSGEQRIGGTLLKVECDRAGNCQYSAGEEMRFTISAVEAKTGNPLPGSRVRCVVHQDGRLSETWEKTLPEGRETLLLKAPEENPGWTLLTVSLLNEKGKKTGADVLCGALVEKDRIRTATPDPEDFDSFWKAQIDTMRKKVAGEKPDAGVERTPMEVPEKYRETVRAWRVRLSCGGGGAPGNSPEGGGEQNFASGILTMPMKAEEKSLPAIVQFHGASTVGVAQGQYYYGEKAIALTLSPHPVESGMTQEYYRKFRKEHLEGYPRRNADNRDKYYMKDMVLRAVRALDYVKTLPEWNGSVLVLHGESQGGFQSIAAAALVPEVTLCVCMVPAMSDHLAYEKKRLPGWPGLIRLTKEGTPQTDEANLKISQNAPYFDSVNFAKRVRCPIYLSTGLLDTTCPPTGILALHANLPDSTERHLYIAADKGHAAGHPEGGPSWKKSCGKENESEKALLPRRRGEGEGRRKEEKMGGERK